MQTLAELGEVLGGFGMRAIDGVHDAVTALVVLFVFGTVLMALATERMEKLELEVAARPARAFAVGLVSMLVSVPLLIALCVTVIGIPIALVGALALGFATYVGIIAALRTFAAALIRHRTENAYLQLALGCVVFLLVGAIPWLGDFVTLTVALIGLGSVVGTRGAGLWPKRTNGFAAA